MVASNTVPKSLAKQSTLVIAGLMLLVVLALWLPFGFIIPHHEPWWLHSQYEAGLVPSVTLNGIRSLHYIIPWLAYKFTPDSFLGYHALMIVGFWAKGFLLFLVLRKVMPQVPEIAIAAGALLIIFPADSAIFIMQATLHHIGLSLLLLSVYLFLQFRDRKNPFWFVAMVVCQWASISVYEAGLPLMYAVPLIAWWLDRKLTRRIVLLSMGWMIVPIFWTVIIVGVFLKPVAEQGYIGQVSRNTLGSDNLFSSIPGSIWKLYPNHFVVPWRDTMDSIGGVSSTFVAVACFTAFSVAIVLFLVRRMPPTTTLQMSVTPRQILGLMIAGLILLALGFVMYLPTDLQDSTIRTYFYTAIGASISLVSLSYLLSQIFKGRIGYGAFVLIIAALVFVAVVRDLEQHSVLARYSSGLQRFLTNIVIVVPNVDEGTYLYLLGDETVEQYEVLISEANEGNILAYLYSDYTMRATSGYFNKGCVQIVNRLSDQFATCVPGADGIIATDPAGTIVIPYSQVVAIQFDENGNTTLLEHFPTDLIDSEATKDYQPEALIRRNQPYPLHARTVLGM